MNRGADCAAIIFYTHMKIDYISESEKYKPNQVSVLLVGEAPPPSKKTYFYLPRALSNSKSIENDRSLPATIFYHYFQKRPSTKEEYENLLIELKKKGIFLVDICDDPIKVRNCPEGVTRIKNEIPNLRNKIKQTGISIPDTDIIFLLARSGYKRKLKSYFPNSRYDKWKDFRLTPSMQVVD